MALTKVSGDFIQDGSITQGHLHASHGITTSDIGEGSNLYFTTARVDSRIGDLSTSDLSEGTNLYYTDARADARIALQVGSNLDLSSKSTSDLSEGTNLYYTQARFNTAFAAKSTSDLSEGTNLYYTDARADARIAAASTSDLSEGTNLYYTDARVGSYLTTNSYATQSYVNTQVSNLVDSAPSTLDTLNELAAALGDDANFSTTVTNSIATKLPLAGGTLTGALQAQPWLFRQMSNQVEYHVLNNGSLNGPSWKFRYDSATANRWVDFGYKDGNGTYYEGLKLYNNSTITWKGNTMWHAANDGSGSGLDADLLDGSHKTDIQRELVNVTSPAVTAADSCLPSTGYGFKHFLGLGPSNNDGHILGMSWTTTSSYGAQIYVDTDPNNIMAFRSRSSAGVWTGWNTVWHTNNDGSGSGLDADLLDGIDSASFVRSDANDSLSGQYTFTKTNDHAIKVGTIRGTAVGSQTGEFIQMYERVNIGGPSGWGASNTATPSYGLSTYGGTRLAVYTDYTESGGSMRAPIFYSSSDTSYYLYPNNQLSLKVYGEICNSNYAEGNLQPGALNLGRIDTDYRWTGSTWSSDVKLGMLLNFSEYYEIGLHDSGDSVNSFMYYNGTDFEMGRDLGWGTQHFTFTESVRTPIFYDSNNTTYYIDPASTGAISAIKTAGGAQIGTSTAHKLTVAGNGNYMNINYDQVWNAGGNLHLQYSSSGNIDMNYGGGYAFSRTSFRAPVFYDSDNTAYRADFTDTGNSIVAAGSYNAQNYNKPALLLNASGTGSSGAAFGMQQVTAEGWTGVFVDYEPYTGWGLYHDNPNNYFCVTAESSAGNIRSFTVPSRVSGNRTSYEKIRFDQNNGNIISGGSMYASSFIDQNNTGYYVDPASKSFLSTIHFNGILSGAGAGSEIGRNHAYDTMELKGYGAELMIGAQHSDIHINYRTCNNGAGGHTPTTWYWRAGASNNWSNHYMGLIESSSSMRAPIFYDSNNTGYYIDPNSVSQISGLTVTNRISGTIDGVGISGYGTNSISFQQTSGSFAGRSGWHNHIICNHGNGSNYYNTVISMDFWGAVYHSRLEGGSYAGPYMFCSAAAGFTSGHEINSSLRMKAAEFWDYNNTNYYAHLDATGYSIRIAGTVQSNYSDIQLKDVIENIPNALDKVNQLNGFYYYPNEIAQGYGYKKKKEVGLSAQEVEAVLPEIVDKAPVSDKYKTIQYERVIPLLVEAIKELKADNDSLRARIETLENQ